MLTNFQNSFADRLIGKFATNSYLNIPVDNGKFYMVDWLL